MQDDRAARQSREMDALMPALLAPLSVEGHLAMGPAEGASLPKGAAGKPEVNRLLGAIAVLVDAINCTLDGDDAVAMEHVRSACETLAGRHRDASLDAVPPGARSDAGSLRGGLAPWQIRRLNTYIDLNLGEPILCEDLARIVRLSLSHFMRAFRDSFGHPPHTFLMRRRLEHAQGLMLTTDFALGQIALDCGLADQSHLSRLFQKFVGESPAAWRRARRSSLDRVRAGNGGEFVPGAVEIRRQRADKGIRV